MHSSIAVRRLLAVAFAVASFAFAFTLARANTDYAKTYGSAWNPPLGEWLPASDTGFEAWRLKQVARVKGYDYFVCGSAAKPTLRTDDFHYPGSVCGPLKRGTAYVYGTAEPIRGTVVYDKAHRIVLYDKGCCAWRGYAFTADTAAPPKPVANADLSAVHTMRGAALGMTQAQLTRIYGPAAPHSVKGRPGYATLSYTTMTGGPNDSEACGQFQSFTFKSDRLVSIELLTGC